MATAESLDCSICHKLCTGPRKLPECGHYCCETCILIYVSKLKDDGDQDIGFQCPTCNVVNPGPKDLKAAIVWIKSLERQKAEPVTESLNKESQNVICNSCNQFERTSKAVKLCLDCNEALCHLCSDGRHTYRELQKHRVVDVAFDDDSSKEAVSSLFQLMCKLTCCDTHTANPIGFYCRHHEEYGCDICVDVKHRKCSDVVKANEEELTKDVAETEAEIIKDTAKSIHQYANTLIELKTTVTEKNKKQTELIKENLTAIRETINTVLDNLQEKTTAHTDSVANKLASAAYNDTSLLKHLIIESDSGSALTESIMSLGCSSQQSIIIHKLKDKMKMHEKTLASMDQINKTTKIGFKIENLLERILNIGLNNTHELFSVTEKNVKDLIPPYKSRSLLAHYKVKKVLEISTQGQYDGRFPAYSVEIILPNNDIVLIDRNNDFAVMIKRNTEAVESLRLSAKFQPSNHRQIADMLQSLASKKEGIVAIPRPSKKQILLLSVGEELAIKGEIKTRYEPKALHVCKNGDIAVAWNNPAAFGIISFGEVLVETKVYFFQDKSGREFQRFNYMAIDEKSSLVIQPCSQNKTVYCFDFEGNPKFQCSDIGTPYGVAIDGDTNIYVSCEEWKHLSYAYIIRIISFSGKVLRTIGSSEICLVKPLALAFNKSGDEFAVTDAENSHVVTIFKLMKY